MDSVIINIIILIIALFFSAFFSAAETAFFSLKKSDLHRFSSSSNKKENFIGGLMNTPGRILITILSGNLFVNIIITAISTTLLLHLWAEYGHLAAIVFVTPVLVIFCEISPRVISINTCGNYSKKSITVLKFFHNLFLPVRILMQSITTMVIKIFSLYSDKEKVITEEEPDMAFRLGAAKGVINKDEETFLNNVLRFSKKEAQNVMIPRNKAVFISYNSTIEEALEIFLKTSAVRAPVYRDKLDNVVGMLDSRELVPYIMGYKKAKRINKFVHDIFHFPGSKELGDLLNDFLSKKIQIAIVLDEYGGTAGVVTLYSILSELMGKSFIQEANRPDKEIKRIDSNTVVISGDTQIHDFNFDFGENLESTESETIGGYIVEQLGYFPKRSEEFETNKYVFRVRHVRKNKIESVEFVLKGNN